MIIDFKNLRVSANYPTYPPYHTGKYLEEYFYDFYIKNKVKFDEIGVTLIPIFWTSVYITGTNRHLIQPYLNALPNDKRYFTVSQHDDAVIEQLPKDTLVFAAGGNSGGTPIPLICSPIPNNLLPSNQKDIFCSFIGSITHPIRRDLYNILNNDDNYFIKVKGWSDKVPENDMNTFFDITSRSKFTLCPRGYGAQSFRFYETIQLNSVPVYIYDEPWLPFSDKINWEDFCVLIDRNNISNIKSILEDIDDIKYNNMLAKGKEVYESYFTLQKTCDEIYNILFSKILRQ